MKKLLFGMAAFAMLFATSCQNEDEFGGAAGNTSNVTFSIGTPKISTRAFSDGATATKLQYAVYDAAGTYLPNLTETEGTINGSTTVNLQLATGNTYSVIFWAAAPDAPYAVDFAEKTMTVDYDGALSNAENRDAFYKYYKFTVKGNQTEKIELKRPFAQLNIGTNDYTEASDAGYNPAKSAVTVKNIYSTLNLWTGAVDGAGEVTFDYEAIPSRDEVFPVNNTEYDYLAMNYLLVAADQALVDVEFGYTETDATAAKTRTVSSVPVQRNYRTNLYGQLITSDVDINVEIKPDYDQPDHGGFYQRDDMYYITSVTGLQYFAELINKGEETDAKLVLEGDIDLAAATRSITGNWVPVGTAENPFKGTFDGNGYSIKNLNIVETEAKEGKAYIGFFGYAKGATIKNVTFENVNINIACLDIDHSQGHIGAVAGSLEGTSTIENVTVKGDIKVEATTTANGASRVAVVAGGNSYGDVTMKNVNVIANEGSYLKANNNVGALAGQLQGKSLFENCSSNIDVTGTKFFAGGIIGLAAGDQQFTNCHTTGNVTITAGREGKAHDQYRVGGIAGGWADGAKNVCTLTNCSYTGTLSGKNSDGSVVEKFDYAGFVGRGYTLNDCAGSKVVIDGVEYVQAFNTAKDAGVYIVNGAYEVGTAEAFLKAVGAVEDGQTIKLTDNVIFNETYRSHNSGDYYDGMYYIGDKSFTIDLNGNTISHDKAVNDYLLNFKNDGEKANTITLKNGTIEAGTTAFCALATSSSNAQKITINTEKIKFVNNNSNGAVAKIRGGAELNVKAGTIIKGENSYVGIEAVGNNTVVNIYDGAEIYQNGTSSYVGAIVGASYNATMNIYGGKGKSAKCGIIVMSTGATINVSGGEWIANNDGTVANDNKGVLVSQNNRYESGWACKSVLNVTGGTFKGGYNCYGMGPGVEADDAQINIKGGNFNADPTKYVVAGYEVTGNYTVGKPQALAKLEEAIANGGNVTLSGDVTLFEPLKIENKVVLDLAGNTITAPLFSAFEVIGGGELTLKNGNVEAYESTVRANGGKVIIESGEYTSTGTAAGSPKTYRYSLDCREGGELIVNGGTFKSNNGMINVGSAVTINGGKFENIVEKGITRHFAYVSAPLTINDGEFYGKANGSAGGCFFCGAGAGGDIQINGGKFTSLWTSGSVNKIFEVYFGGTINVTGGMFNTNGGIATFVKENIDETTKAAYPYIAK